MLKLAKKSIRYIMNASIEEDSKKEQDLAKMKRNALILLGIAVVLFVVANVYKINWLKAFSEAAMVGGIADWFAVVALFRHPLGIPIPHTALIPSNKDKIGENLGNFVSDEFLTREKLELKIEQFNVAIKASDWLIDEKNANTVAILIIENVIPGLLKTIDDEEVQRFIQTQFSGKLSKVNLAEWIALGLESLTKRDKQEQLVTNVLKTLIVELQSNKHVIEEKVKSSTPFLSFGLADKKITEGIFNGLYDFLDQASHQDSTIRKKVNNYVVDFIIELKESPEMQQKVNDLVLGFANKKEVQDYISGIWLEIKTAIANDLNQKEASIIKNSIANMIQSFGKGIQADQLMMDKINNFIKNDVMSVLINNKKMIGELISSTVKSWDTDEVSKKLELEIGSDLQYIRINGTLVGGLVGLLIYAVEHVLHKFIN
ncbi:COG2733 Predicted membrane protein [Flavobacteriaceae bacterium]